MSKKLMNLGINNKNTVIIKEQTINDNVFEDIEYSLKRITDIFEAEDKKINELLPHRVLINKTGEREQYKTEKIIHSLLNLGIPLIPTYEIANATIKKLQIQLQNDHDFDTYLSTKDIRKMVSLAIQECNTSKYSMSDIESWSNKYARRYGHNNRNVEIYWDKSEKVKDVSYDYIANEFLDDVINDISHGNSIKSELSATYRRDMATEILDFINHCDLYRIRYGLLKQMVIEIATQPPHPWMVYNTIRNDILKYDYDALMTNMKTLNKALKNNADHSIPQSAELEILHHAAALLLGMHNYFFGCYDLTAFFQLKEVLKTLQDSFCWNDAITRSKVSSLLTDISFAGIEINKLVCLIDRLAINVREHKILTTEFAQDVQTFGNWAIQIYDLGNRDKIEHILNSNWDEHTPEEVLSAVKPLLYSIFPSRRYKITYEKNYFWINYSFVNLPSFEKNDYKSSLFVIYADTIDMDIEFLELLSANQTKKNCNTILLITEDNNSSIILNHRINQYLAEKTLFEYYQLICFTKNNLKSLYESADKVYWLDNYLSSIEEL